MKFEFDIYRNLHMFQDLTEPHWHEGMEILVCLSDGGKFQINNNLYPLCRGMVFLVNKGEIHTCLVDFASYDRYILHISYETLWLLSSMETNFTALFEDAGHYTVFDDEQLEKIGKLMDSCMEVAPGFGLDFKRNIALMQTILYLGTHLKTSSHTIEPSHSNGFSKILPIINYVHEHYCEEITLDKLSQDFFISKYHMCRLFKVTTGFTVGAYITNYRIRQACHLLRKGLSVQETGEQVGFCNNAHFISVFKRIMGLPPGKYSKSHLLVDQPITNI